MYQRLGREQAYSVDCPALRERGVHPRQRARREQAVGRRDGDAQRLRGAEVEVADAAWHERIGDARQVETHAEQVEPALQQPRWPCEQLGGLASVPAQAAETGPCEESALPPDQLGRAVELVERRADVHAVEPERLRDQLAHQLGEAPPGHALYDLADQVAVREPVVARA